MSDHAHAILACLSHPSICEDFRRQIRSLASANAAENPSKAAAFVLMLKRVETITTYSPPATF
ncbi:hypothetical protein LK996_16285 [Lysobacter sp. A6]|uniref:Uncharacterized protein n=1 Tax=Noviluteimonas lactosilytica TaxID=2888523 RepID=A0ABS8JLX4_9GAMM|nr:hypothetical protein [Lysobacter lactosilyticus]MCC8364630.1 hypothetical protein [Lysobacter lactosilyticus]